MRGPWRAGAVVAFTERDTLDPMTGAPGVLRREWCTVPMPWGDARALAACTAHFGDVWLRNNPHNRVLILTRYIRRGTVEPWEPFDAFPTRLSALYSIDPGVTAVDTALVKIQHDRAAQAAEDAKAREESAHNIQRQRERAATLRVSHRAYDKMLTNGDRDAEQWRAMIAALVGTDKVAALQTDADFVALHESVVTSTNIPNKRRAIRACVDWLMSHGYADCVPSR